MNLQETEGTEKRPNALVFCQRRLCGGVVISRPFFSFSYCSGLDNLDHQLLALLSSPTRHAAPSPFHRPGTQKSC